MSDRKRKQKTTPNKVLAQLVLLTKNPTVAAILGAAGVSLGYVVFNFIASLTHTDSILVTSLSSDETVTILNTGDGDVFIETIDMLNQMTEGAYAYPIEKVVKPDQTITHRFQYTGPPYSVLSVSQDAEEQEMLQLAESYIKDGACFRLKVWDTQHRRFFAEMGTASNLNSGLISFPVTVRVYYRSITTQERNFQSVPAVGVIHVYDHCEGIRQVEIPRF